MEIFSIFTITTRDGKVSRGEGVEGQGQGVMKYLRRNYPRFTRFVLEGFEIDGVFKPLTIKNKNSTNDSR